MGATRQWLCRWAVAPVAVLAVVTLGGCAGDVDDTTGGPEVDAPAPSGPTSTGEVHIEGTTVVPLEIVNVGDATLALIRVELAGQGPFPFALDTGAARSIVDEDVVDRLGLATAGSADVSGVTGTTRARTVTIPDWSIGDIALGERVLAAVPMPEPERGKGLQGLLGSDVLSTFGRVTVDYDAGELHLAPR